MGIIEGLILIIMCILRIIIINLPSLLIMIGIQAVTYWITGISLYNKFLNYILMEVK